MTPVLPIVMLGAVIVMITMEIANIYLTIRKQEKRAEPETVPEIWKCTYFDLEVTKLK